MARMVPLAIGSRMMTLSFQRGARTSSQSCGASARGTARLLQILNGGLNITFDHNTSFSTGAILVADQAPSSGLRFTNNLVTRGSLGVFGSGVAEGAPSLASYFPSAVFLRNAIIGASDGIYPSGNLFPAGINDVGFVDYSAGDYRLLAEMLIGLVRGKRALEQAEILAREWGAYLIAQGRPKPGTKAPAGRNLASLQEAMARAGFDTRFRRRSGDAVEVTLRACPFKDLADDHRDLVCTLHRGLIEGILAGLQPALAVKEFVPFADRGSCRLNAG
jgi:predicted hydrocarbon binding protein